MRSLLDHLVDSWALQENFVADEARAVLPHVGATRLNLSANYLSLLIFVMFQNGLLDALVHMATSDGPFSQRAFKILKTYLSLGNQLKLLLRRDGVVTFTYYSVTLVFPCRPDRNNSFAKIIRI